VGPIYHYTEPRVRAHLLLCMLAYLVQRTLLQAWAPLLFADEAPPQRPDPVAPAERSAEARRKDQTQLNAEGQPLHSFRTFWQTSLPSPRIAYWFRERHPLAASTPSPSRPNCSGAPSPSWTPCPNHHVARNSNPLCPIQIQVPRVCPEVRIRGEIS
jgi:hypothetical protein